MRYALLFALICTQAPSKKDEVLDLAQLSTDEAARKMAHAVALSQGKLTGNRVAARQLFDSQERERSTFKGKAFEGFVIVLGVDTLARERQGYFVMGLVEGVPGAQVTCNADDSDDPILRQLKRGDRVYVRGQVGKRVDQFEGCTFAVMNVSAAKGKSKAKVVAKASPQSSDEDKATGRLKVAQTLLKDGSAAAGRNRLEMLIRDLPKTKAAEEARKILGVD